jgi:hypothetical protein
VHITRRGDEMTPLGCLSPSCFTTENWIVAGLYGLIALIAWGIILYKIFHKEKK